MSKYYIEYGALQANGKRLIECETSALDAKKITEDFAREIADALNGREAWKQEKAEIEADALAVGGIVEAARTAEKSSAVGNAAACKKRDEVVLRLSKDEYRGMQEALSEHDCLCEMLSEFRMSVGNAASMREALEAARDLLLPQCNGGTAFAKACGETVNKIMDALAKPPRNCDFYDNKTDAETRFVEETGENDMAQHYWQMFAIWLFAPAAERKGDGDATI